MAPADTIDYVRVRPYIGSNYGKVSPFGLTVLLLGESHYDPNPLTPTYTEEVVQLWLDGNPAGNRGWHFFPKTAGAFYGHSADRGTRLQFWRSVVFYNFIQETVGANHRNPPTADMWERAKPALTQVLDEFGPQFVLVVSNRLWQWHLPSSLGTGPSVQLEGGESKLSRTYSGALGRRTFLFGINHPNSYGWSYGKWTPWVKAALAQAHRFHEG